MTSDPRPVDQAPASAAARAAATRVRWIGGVLVILLLAGVCVAAIAAFRADLDQAAVADLLRRNRASAAFLVILLMVAHCFVPFPAEVLALAAGAIFGVVYGVALIWVGAMIGACLSFWLARRLGRPFVLSFLPARHAARLDRWRGRDLITVLLLSRLAPVIAFNLINFAAGLTQVSWFGFLWTTAIGILPMTVLAVWLGAGMADLPMGLTAAIFSAVFAVVLAVHLIIRARRADPSTGDADHSPD